MLRGLSNETVQFLGLNLMWSRPEWLVITVFPVAPPHVRPSVIMEGAASSDDDLTHMYGHTPESSRAEAHRGTDTRSQAKGEEGGYWGRYRQIQIQTHRRGQPSEVWLGHIHTEAHA